MNCVFKIKKQKSIFTKLKRRADNAFWNVLKKTKNKSASQLNQLIILMNLKRKRFANAMTTKKLRKHFVKNFSQILIFNSQMSITISMMNVFNNCIFNSSIIEL